MWLPWSSERLTDLHHAIQQAKVRIPASAAAMAPRDTRGDIGRRKQALVIAHAVRPAQMATPADRIRTAITVRRQVDTVSQRLSGRECARSRPAKDHSARPENRKKGRSDITPRVANWNNGTEVATRRHPTAAATGPAGRLRTKYQTISAIVPNTGMNRMNTS